jgi:hypothetical protein
MIKNNKGACFIEPIPFDGEDQKREVKKTKNTKQEYVNSVIDADIKSGTNRSLYGLSELDKLASEQYDDMNTFNIKPEVINVR